tara:strand:- start:1133 stop:2182 length:1050 start_codon:yes stop_codon:yes gene_type:complete
MTINKKELLKPFPKEYVKKAPKGKFGSYVSHFRYVERLRDCLDEPYSWEVEATYGTHNGEKRIVGAKGTIHIEGLGKFDGVGDVEPYQLNNQSDGTNFKFAESDSFKRACLRFGLGVELWSGDVTEEEDMVKNAQPDDNVAKKSNNKVPYTEELQRQSDENAHEEELLSKKKQVNQENGNSHSEISEVQLKKLIFDMCEKDEKFARACWKSSLDRTKLKDKSVTDNVGEWEKFTVEMFLEFADNYVKKFTKDFEIRAGNSDIINDTLDSFNGKIIEKEKENEMAEIPSGDWEQDPISEQQVNFIKSLITQCIDAGKDEVASEGKTYINSGTGTKKNASDVIDKLKNALN